MSTAVEINGLTLVPIKEAALRVSYTRDYVARLAREGKIVASQVGRQWFVDPVSLENFSAEATALEEVRKQDLRAERKRELMAKESLSVLDDVVTKRIAKQRFDALVVTAAVMCLGLFGGVGLYTASQISDSPLANFSRSLAVVSVPVRSEEAVIVPKQILPVANEERSTLLLSTVVEQPVFTATSEMVKMSDQPFSGVLVLADGGLVPSEAGIATMFSDEVEVEFIDEHSGVITYGVGEGVKKYPFVRIPDSNGSTAGTP